MTAILRPTSSNSFYASPSAATCRLEGPFSFPQNAPESDAISLSTIIHERSRQPSPASVFSLTSALLLRNDENASPQPRLGDVIRQGRSISTNSCKTPEEPTRTQKHICQQLLKITDIDDGATEGEDDTAWSDNIEFDGDAVVVTAETSLHKIPSNSDRSVTLALGAGKCQDDSEDFESRTRPLGHQIKPVTSKSCLPTRMRQRSFSKENIATAPLPTSIQRSLYPQRFSDASSGFVHSMKTASVTNASFSVAARSSRVGRSTDSYILQSSQPRYSIESDRPTTNSTSDDAALKRGFKRQQIIDELIATEESYISDLKALVYLYSTLLASTSSIPNKVRVAIERNVAYILHIHEEVLAKFYEARLRAAARRWADTEMPARLGQQRKAHSQRVPRDVYLRESFARRRTRSSIESAEVFGSHPRLSGCAEPIDVFEITNILKAATKDFYAYEEYCANFELIGHELQKHTPHLWPTYESGMESLARVIMTIDQRQINDHKGLTVGDLLIKPIQRLTKYPLLLQQLLNNTHVTDAPGTYMNLETVLQSIRDVVQTVNLARENPYTRQQIQRRWLVQDRLDLSKLGITSEQFRSLGSIELCGILHVTYQTSAGTSGCYALTILFSQHFLIALPAGTTGKFEAVALIQLSDLKIETATDGKGETQILNA